MLAVDDTFCCFEVAKVKEKLKYIYTMHGLVTTAYCITRHPEFQSVCLDPWTMQVAYFASRQEHNELDGHERHG